MFIKRYRLLSGLCCCLLASLAFGHEDEADEHGQGKPLNQAEQQVADVLDAYAAAYAATDIDGIKALVASDAFSYFEGAGADQDWEDYASHLAAEMPSFSNARYVFNDIDPEINGAMAFATFDWTMDVLILSDQFPDGRHPVSMAGLGTAVLVREADEWRLRHLHTARKPAAK